MGTESTDIDVVERFAIAIGVFRERLMYLHPSDAYQHRAAAEALCREAVSFGATGEIVRSIVRLAAGGSALAAEARAAMVAVVDQYFAGPG